MKKQGRIKLFGIRFWPVFIVIGLGLYLVDPAHIVVQLLNLSMIGVILLFAYFQFHDREGKGMFPYIDLPRLVNRAGLSPIGSGLVVLAVLYLLSAIIQAAVVR